MKSALLGSTLLVMLAGVANAADVMAPVSSDWTGAYVGVIGGYAWGSADLSSDIDSPIPPPTVPTSLEADSDMDGWLGGAQIGYDYDFGSGFVLGAVADWAFTGLESDEVCLEDFGPGCDGSVDDAYGYASLDWLTTFRARAGFAAGDALIYATGGLALGSVEVNVDNLETLGDDYSDSDTLTGWAAGAGIEYRLTENVSIGAEYLYVDLGAIDTNYAVEGINPGDTTIDSETDFSMSIVKAALNFRF